MGQKRSPKKLAKFISYVLGRRPDEFGLVPDSDGFVKIKEFFKAVWEEDGWKFVRRSDIDELMMTLADPPVEIRENTIRAKRRDSLPKNEVIAGPPKLLYTCVRRKAYPHAMENGISPGSHPRVVLSASRDMAARIGRRIDQEPVLLVIQTQKAQNENVAFYQAGETLYLADYIPVGCFSGPPPPKKKTEKPKQPETEAPKTRDLPGSFFLDISSEYGKQKEQTRKQKHKEIAWKKERKRMKKQKKNIDRYK
ncbi:RNA 2'-phosphotransferase [Thermodesulfobacteriota bacterium]